MRQLQHVYITAYRQKKSDFWLVTHDYEGIAMKDGHAVDKSTIFKSLSTLDLTLFIESFKKKKNLQKG